MVSEKIEKLLALKQTFGITMVPISSCSSCHFGQESCNFFPTTYTDVLKLNTLKCLLINQRTTCSCTALLAKCKQIYFLALCRLRKLHSITTGTNYMLNSQIKRTFLSTIHTLCYLLFLFFFSHTLTYKLWWLKPTAPRQSSFLLLHKFLHF